MVKQEVGVSVSVTIINNKIINVFLFHLNLNINSIQMNKNVLYAMSNQINSQLDIVTLMMTFRALKIAFRIVIWESFYFHSFHSSNQFWFDAKDSLEQGF